MNATTATVDLEKSAFQLAGADSGWSVTETYRLTPAQVVRWFQNREVAYGS
jgi:hypothetical protein